MTIRRTKHAVYDLKYHLVWIPKYRKQILSKEVARYLKEVFQRNAEEYEFRIDQGGNEQVQLEAVLAQFSLYGNR